MLVVRTFTLAVLLTSALGPLAFAQDEADSTLKTEVPKLEKPAPRKIKGDWKFSLKGGGFNEGRDEGVAAMFSLETRFNYRFNSILSARIEPEVELFSGRLQERYDNDAYSNHIGLNAGYLALVPIQYLEGRAGVISQEFLDNPLLISQGRSFPGLQEIVSTGKAMPVKVSVIAQQTIPTSYTLSTERSDKEALPTFHTQSLHIEGRHKALDWHVMGGHFAYANLPDKVAYQAAQTGNSVLNGEIAPGAQLQYAFNGYFWQAEADFNIFDRARFELSYNGVVNSAAPSYARDGQHIGGGPRFYLGNDTDLRLKYYSYFSESDSTLSRYARASNGYTNRIGDVIEVELDFKKEGFKVKGQYINARTLAGTPNQFTLTQYYLGVETANAPF